MLTKGVRIAKVDFNFRQNVTECQQQQRVNGTSFPNGCLVLTHYYASSGHVLNYFTPYDLVDFLDANGDADFLSPARVARSGPLIIQMCLKNKPGHCCPQTPGSACDKWAALFDSFYAAVRAQIPDLIDQQRVRFVFDSLSTGDGSSGGGDSCFVLPKPRWGALTVSTWTGNMAAALSNNGSFAMARMPNMAWTSWAAWAEIGCGKQPLLRIGSSSSCANWGKFRASDATAAFPIVAWEPASELALELWYSWYLSTSLYHGAGALVAFNEDPALFHVLTSPTTKRFAHALIGSKKKMEGGVAALFYTAADPPPSSSGGLPYLLQCASPEGGPTIECAISMRANHSQFLTLGETVSTISPSSIVNNISLPLLHMTVEQILPRTSAAFQFRVTLADSQGALHLLQMSIDSPRPSSAPKWALLCPAMHPFASSKLFSVNSFYDETSSSSSSSSSSSIRPLTFVAAHLQNDGPGARSTGEFPLTVTAASFSQAPVQPSAVCPFMMIVLPQTRVVANVCKNNTKDCGAFDTTLRTANPRLEKQSEKGKSSTTNWFAAGVGATAAVTEKKGTSKREMRVVACYSVGRAVYCTSAVFASSSSSAQYTLQSAIPNVTSGTPVKVGVGRRPTISFEDTTSSYNKSVSLLTQRAFFLRFGESYCQNDMLIDDNTGIFNGVHICDLRDTPRFQVLPMMPSPIQAYMWARSVLTLESHLAEGNLHLNGFASVCDPSLMHGVFDTSVDAGNPILVPAGAHDDNVQQGDYVVVQVSSSLVWGAPTTCGSSLPGGGAVRLDVFPMPTFLFSYSNKSF